MNKQLKNCKKETYPLQHTGFEIKNCGLVGSNHQASAQKHRIFTTLFISQIKRIVQ